MARPRGQFDEQKEVCYQLIIRLTKPTCWASNGFLATKLGCSVRQVTRYIAALVKENRLVLNMKRYLREGMKTRRFLRLASAVRGKFGKPMYATPPSENRYEPAETVTPVRVVSEIVRPRFGKPEYDMSKTTEVHHGVEYEVPKPGAEPVADPVDARVARMKALLEAEDADDARIEAAESADPALAFRHMEFKLRAVERAQAIKLDVSHKVPKEEF